MMSKNILIEGELKKYHLITKRMFALGDPGIWLRNS